MSVEADGPQKLASADRGYEVGYGKPPAAHRFQKGRSGNAGGRPRRSRSIAVLLREALEKQIRVTENGQQRTVTTKEAFVAKLIAGAIKGSQRDTRDLLRMLETYLPESKEQQQIKKIVRVIVDPSNRKMLDG